MKPSEYIRRGGETPPEGIDTHPEPYVRCGGVLSVASGRGQCALRQGHKGPHRTSGGTQWGGLPPEPSPETRPSFAPSDYEGMGASSVCGVCGGMQVRTGMCEVCTSCGTSGGCG